MSRARKLKWYYENAVYKKSNNVLETSYESRIKDLSDYILVLENEKNEIEQKL